MATRDFDRIIVKVDGVAVDPAEHGLDVGYIEQEKTPAGYVGKLFSELWLTGRFSHNGMAESIASAMVYGTSGSDEFFLGRADSFAFEWETTGGKAYE